MEEPSNSGLKRKRCTDLTDLHEDILVEVLSKVPVKSLLKFKSVSKEWDALIKSSNFIVRQRSDHRHNPCLLLEWISVSESLTKVSLLRDQQTPLSSLDLSFLPQDHRDFKFVGSSNGLVCCSIEDGTVLIVWNPATRQSRSLPKPKPSLLEDGVGTWACCNNYPLSGFDFIPELSQYKVVSIFPTTRTNIGDGTDGDGKVVTFGARVFLQSTNSWREVKNELEIPSLRNCLTCLAVTSNGVVYCMVEKTSSEYCIMSFDLRDEVFCEIQLPKELRYLQGCSVPLIPWKGSVAILTKTNTSESGVDFDLVLWLLINNTSKNDREWKQIERFRSTNSGDIGFRPTSEEWFVGVWKDQFILNKRLGAAPAAVEEVRAALAENLVAYDPKSKAKHKILDHVEEVVNWVCRGISYVETLVPV